MIGVYACQCRASYYTTLFRVIWQLCSPQTAHILTLPMQSSIDGSAPRESPQHAYRYAVHVITSMHIIVAGTLHRAVIGSMRIRLLLLQDHKTNACKVAAVIVVMLATDTAEELCWHSCGELPRQSPAQTVIVCTPAVSCCCVDAAES